MNDAVSALALCLNGEEEDKVTNELFIWDSIDELVSLDVYVKSVLDAYAGALRMVPFAISSELSCVTIKCQQQAI